MKNDLFAAYSVQSVADALEALAATCIAHGMQPPKKIIFHSGDLTKFSELLSPKTRSLEEPVVLAKITVCAGYIELEEDSN